MKSIHKVVWGILLLGMTIHATAQIKSQWRGAQRDGKYADTGLLKEWPADGPQKLWTLDNIGIGHSSAAVAENVVYITGMDQSKGFVSAVDLDGNLLWKKSYGKEWDTSFDGTRTTPTIDGDMLYLLSGFGEAICLNTQNGEVVWKVNILEKFGGENLLWGITESPAIHGDMVYFTPGGPETFMVALNKKDGTTLWKSTNQVDTAGKGFKSAYCSPAIFDHNGKTILCSHNEKFIIGIDANSGEMLFSYPWENRWFVHANTPLYKNGQIFCASGYGKGSIMLKLAPSGRHVTKLWENTDFDARMTGFVEHDGYLYGSGEKKHGWVCVDWKTGKTMYSAKDIQIGSVIYADGMLYCYSERGQVALVKPTPEKFELISQFQLTESTKQNWPHPVIYKGILLIRYQESLHAFNIKK